MLKMLDWAAQSHLPSLVMFLRLAVSNANAAVIEISSSASIFSLVLLYRRMVEGINCRLPVVFLFLSLMRYMANWVTLS